MCLPSSTPRPPRPRLILFNFISLFLLFSLVSASSSSSSSSSDTHILSPFSRTPITRSLISSRVRQSHLHPNGLSEHLFEWIPSRKILISASASIDLSLHSQSTRIRPHSSSTLRLNGKQVNPQDYIDALITTSSDGTVSAVFHENELVHVWGSAGLHIAPLPGAPHSSIFVAERIGSSVDEPMCPPEDLYPESLIMEMNNLVANRTNTTTTTTNDSDNDHDHDHGEDATSMAATTSSLQQLSDSPEPSMEPMLGECAKGIPHYFEIATAYDNSLCRFYNNNAKRTFSMIAVLLHASSRPYLLDTCVRLALVHVDGHCKDPNDPYAILRESATFFLLLEFISIWQRPEYNTIPRDVAYFIGGFNDGTSTVGAGLQGERGGVCNNRFGFGWVEGIIPGVFAHELGHNLGARHTETGLMRPFYEPRTQIPRFSNESVQLITTFIDTNTFAQCITTDIPTRALVPIANVAPSPTILPEYGTCAVSRRRANVLQCTQPRYIGCIRNTTTSFKLGYIDILSWQEFGIFKVDIKPRRSDVSIVQFRGLQSFNGSISPLTVRLRPQDMNITKTQELRREDVRIRWPRPKLTCCDQRLHVYINIRWCRDSNLTNECVTSYQQFSRRVPCRSPCFGIEGGKVLAMGMERRCPSCLIPKSNSMYHSPRHISPNKHRYGYRSWW